MEIVRTRSYEVACRRLIKLGATERDIEAMEIDICHHPDAGAVIPGSGGLRKVRFGFASRGKRGGGRTIYYAMTQDGLIYLLFAYAKGDQEDLTADQKRMFKVLIKELTRG